MMKRSLCFIFAAVMLLSLISCTKQEITIVGTWEYDNNYALKDLVTDQLDDSYFYKVYYQFNEDGTGKTWTSYSPDFKADFTYSYDGDKLTVTLDDGKDQVLDITLDHDHFTVSYGEEKMYFYKIN